VPVGSGSGFKNSDLLEPDPAENGPDLQPCFSSHLKASTGIGRYLLMLFFLLFFFAIY